MDSPIFIGKYLVELDEADSTNDFALGMIKNSNTPEGAAVTAGYQKGGKGYQGAAWESEDGKNILVSIILYPHFLRPVEQFLLNAAISLGVYRFIYSMGIDEDLAIKWPNDIYVRGKKIAGILIENVLAGNTYKAAVAGIGINVNQERFATPVAVSMKNITGAESDIKPLLEKLFKFLEAEYLSIRGKDSQAILQEYEEKLYRKDMESRFADAGGKEFTGIIRGIDSGGRLRVEENGNIKAWYHKEIIFKH